jgi:hypothetical protein
MARPIVLLKAAGVEPVVGRKLNGGFGLERTGEYELRNALSTTPFCRSFYK